MFNINHKVRVKLTPHGRQFLKNIGQGWRLEMSTHQEDANGWSHWQLWDLMSTFGPAVYMGGNVPFETTIEIIEGQS